MSKLGKANKSRAAHRQCRCIAVKPKLMLQQACSVQPCQSQPTFALATLCTAQFTKRLVVRLRPFPPGSWPSDEWLTRLFGLCPGVVACEELALDFFGPLTASFPRKCSSALRDTGQGSIMRDLSALSIRGSARGLDVGSALRVCCFVLGSAYRRETPYRR